VSEKSDERIQHELLCKIEDLERQLKVEKDENTWLRDHDNEWCVFYYQVKEKDAEIQRLKWELVIAKNSSALKGEKE